jgi:hypothetical protein
MFKFGLLLGPDRVCMVGGGGGTLGGNTKLLTLYVGRGRGRGGGGGGCWEQTELTGTLNYRLYTIIKISTKN